MFNPRITLLICILLLSLSASQSGFAQEERVWMDSTETHKITATMIKLEDGTVYLLKDDGNSATIKLEALREEDQEYARLIANGSPAAETTPKNGPEGPKGSSVPSPELEPERSAQPELMPEPATEPEPAIEPEPPRQPQPAPVIDSSLQYQSAPNQLIPAFAPEFSSPETTTNILDPAPLSETSAVNLADVESLSPRFRKIGLLLYQRKDVVSVAKGFEAAWGVSEVPPTIIKLLHETADSKNKYLRSESIKLLAILDPRNSFEKILEAVTDNQSFDVRWTALNLVQYLQDDRAVPTLIQRFDGRDHYKVFAALSTFGPRIEEKCFPLLNETEVKTDKDGKEYEKGVNRKIHIDAVRLMGRIGTEKSVPALENLRDNAKKITIRLQAETALKQIQARINSN